MPKKPVDREYSVRLSKAGYVVIPAVLRWAMGLYPGDEVVLIPRGEDLVLTTKRTLERKAKEMDAHLRERAEIARERDKW